MHVSCDRRGRPRNETPLPTRTDCSSWASPVPRKRVVSAAVSEFGLVGDNISELALGRYGFILTFAFVVSGLGVIGLSYAIRQYTVGSRGRWSVQLLSGSMA